MSLENKVNILENNIKEIQIKLNEKPNIICEQKLNQLENKSNNNNN